MPLPKKFNAVSANDAVTQLKKLPGIILFFRFLRFLSNQAICEITCPVQDNGFSGFYNSVDQE